MTKTKAKFVLAAFTAALLATSAPVKAKQVEFDQASIPELEAAMAAGTLTSEKLVQLCLDRIKAFDREGPKVHAVMAINAKALEEARALDAERKAGKVRGPLHGIPVVLKDNYNTVEMPTTGGSVILEGSIPSSDAYMVKRLRDAGAIMLAKVNLGEFANGMESSLGGQSHNPHDLSRTPAGSSGGTGVAIASGFAPLGLGTDTGGSIRGPSSVNGIVGLKPTHGLVSREGIIPLALSLDTGGPMARNVADIAAALGQMTGVDPNDDATKKSQGKFEKDYTKYLKADGLKGARIGLARDFMGADPDVDWLVEAAVLAMKKQGATFVDVHYPKWFLDSSNGAVFTLYPAEFKVQIGEYLKKYTGPKYPKSLDELMERQMSYTSLGADGAHPNISRWIFMRDREKPADALTDPGYKALHEYYMPMTTALVNGILAKDKLDAIVYPTGRTRPVQIAAPPGPPSGTGISPTGIANLSGFPDLIVPAGFTTDDLPVTVSFFGTAFSEPKLLAMGYAYEQATHNIRRPVNTPALGGGTMINVPDKAGPAQ